MSSHRTDKRSTRRRNAMTTYTMSETLTNLRQALRKYAWWLSLILVLFAAVSAGYWAISQPVVAAPIISSTSQSMSMNPAQQAVFDYLWAHSSNRPNQAPTETLDPAQQSVMQYLH